MCTYSPSHDQQAAGPRLQYARMRQHGFELLSNESKGHGMHAHPFPSRTDMWNSQCHATHPSSRCSMQSSCAISCRRHLKAGIKRSGVVPNKECLLDAVFILFWGKGWCCCCFGGSRPGAGARVAGGSQGLVMPPIEKVVGACRTGYRTQSVTWQSMRRQAMLLISRWQM